LETTRVLLVRRGKPIEKHRIRDGGEWGQTSNLNSYKTSKSEV